MPDFLPKKYEFPHEFCPFLHDILVDIIKSGEPAGAFNASFTLRSEEDVSALRALSGEALWDWLLANDYESIVRDVACRQSFLALLSDFCHFVFEALGCSRKAKLSVTYALLRKPFKESLFYIEWMLADRTRFLDALLEQGPHQLDVGRAVSEEQKRAIIRKAILATAHPQQHDAAFIYDMRYNKLADYGFDKLWTQATHVVTTQKSIATERQNLNFVFHGEGVKESQWEFLYTRLPILLDYAVDVVEALFSTLVSTDPEWIESMEMRRHAGFVLWHLGMGERSGYDQLRKAMAEEPAAACPACGAIPDVDEAAVESLYRTGGYTCPRCQSTIIPPDV